MEKFDLPCQNENECKLQEQKFQQQEVVLSTIKGTRSTEVSDEDLANGIKDEFGAIYSPNGKRLLKGADVDTYVIRHGTEVICSEAFSFCNDLTSITIPNSVVSIGNNVFYSCI